jgi:hypothetical protein
VAAEQGCHRGLGDHLAHDDFGQRQDEVKLQPQGIMREREPEAHLREENLVIFV